MRKTASLLVLTAFVLTACGFVRDSRINPANWFGRAEPAEVAVEENTNPLIPRQGGFFRNPARELGYQGQPFDQVTTLRVERIPGGAIIRATGLATRQGIYDVQLTPENEDEEAVDGVLTYRLEGLRPARNTAVGTVPTREVTAARRVTDRQLAGVRTIRVEGARNALVTRR